MCDTSSITVGTIVVVKVGRNEIEVVVTEIGENRWKVKKVGSDHEYADSKNERVLDQLTEIAQNPAAFYPIHGAHRRFPLSTYIKKKLRGRIDGFLRDALHEYNNNSGQDAAKAEQYGASR